MAAERQPVKLPRYNLSMSRRTRRPAPSSDAKEEDDELQKQNYEFQRMSLKELTKESNVHKINELPIHELGETSVLDDDLTENIPCRTGRASAEPEKSLAGVAKQVESAGVVGGCLKALSHLIKVKHSSRQRRTNPRFLVQ